MTEFKFIDDIPRTGRGTRQADPLIVEFAEALRANPGRWAEYPYTFPVSGANSFAYRVNKLDTAPKPLREPEFQAVVRGGLVYIRYVEETA
jgi:hypothetical protein